jgi:hypothetical protein
VTRLGARRQDRYCLEAQTPALRLIYARTSTTLAVQLPFMFKASSTNMLFELARELGEFSRHFAVCNIDRYSAAKSCIATKVFRSSDTFNHCRHHINASVLSDLDMCQQNHRSFFRARGLE